MGDPSPCASTSNCPAKASSTPAASTQPNWLCMDPIAMAAPAPAPKQGQEQEQAQAATGPRAGPSSETGAEPGPPAAATAAIGRARERLAARIAKLAAAGADVSLLSLPQAPPQPQPGCCQARAAQPDSLDPAQPAPLQAAARAQEAVAEQGFGAAGLAAPASLGAPGTLEGLEELPPLDDLMADCLLGGGGDELAGDGRHSAAPRPLSPLLPLLDFDWEQAGMPAGTAGGAGAGGAAGGPEGGAALADSVSDWISRQLADHAMLCEGPAAQHAQRARKDLEEADSLLSLLDEIEAPLAAAEAAGGSGSENGYQLAQMAQHHTGITQEAHLQPAAMAAPRAPPLCGPGPGLPVQQQQPQPQPAFGMGQAAVPAQPWAQQQWAPAAAPLDGSMLPFPARPFPHDHLHYPQHPQQLQQHHYYQQHPQHHFYQQQQQQGSYALACSLVGQGAPAPALPPPLPPPPPPPAAATLAKVSVKLFGCTPEELPAGGHTPALGGGLTGEVTLQCRKWGSSPSAVKPRPPPCALLAPPLCLAEGQEEAPS